LILLRHERAIAESTRVANQWPKGTLRLAERVQTLKLVVRAATSIVCLAIVESIAPFPVVAIGSNKSWVLLCSAYQRGMPAEPKFLHRAQIRHAFAVAFVYPRSSNKSWKRNRGFQNA
jgi:hypothetical protein